MSEMTFKDKRFWSDFINLYRSLPAVWNTKSKEYSNRSLKTAAYRKLVKKLKEIEPDANRDSAVRKINVLRTNYRRDVKKIKLYRTAGEVYTSNFWYFDLLHSFLNKDSDIGDSSAVWSTANFKTEDDDEEEEEIDMDEIEQKPIINDHLHQHLEASDIDLLADNEIEQQMIYANKRGNSVNNEDDEIEIPMCSMSGLPLPTTKRRRISYNEAQASGSDIFVDASHRNKSITFTPKNSETSLTMAKSWATQYEELSTKQRIIARKMISDILFYGCLGQLHETHAIELQEIVRETGTSKKITTTTIKEDYQITPPKRQQQQHRY